jgi:hypothetical protein
VWITIQALMRYHHSVLASFVRRASAFEKREWLKWGRLQPFRASKKPQSSAHLCPIWGAKIIGSIPVPLGNISDQRYPRFA